MKNSKILFAIFLMGLMGISSISPVFAANQYSVNPGANFRWDATKYYFMKDGLGPGSDLSYTHHYFLEFNFTNWAGISGAEYLNGTINNNGTIYNGEISHATYYFGTPAQSWVTQIIDTSNPYPIHVYLICNTEIIQTTKPELQNLAANSNFTFGEAPTNNFSLTGTYVTGDITETYTGNIKFNSDKVLSYIFDEMVTKDLGVLKYVERYTWTLTYTPGTGADPNGNGDPNVDSSIPGFYLYSILIAMGIGFIYILKKNRYFKRKNL
ncbi:hypothetical protein LCGC14_0954610 [marine sediment metagenome]|uniref:Uncharacterized protein n=1 Tax=marine sediment metagenome TaxID=412755 RepID=A0A0F9NKT0_9ZZZZ